MRLPVGAMDTSGPWPAGCGGHCLQALTTTNETKPQRPNGSGAVTTECSCDKQDTQKVCKQQETHALVLCL